MQLRNKRVQLVQIRTGLRCRTFQPGRLLRGHLRPTLVGGHLNRQLWANGNQNDLKNFLKKWANVQTLQLQPQNDVRNMPSAVNIIIFQLHQKRHGIKKTQDWHFAPWAFSLLLEPVKVFEGPWKCPWGPFLESLCQLRMIAVARLTVHKPKMSTENAATDRKLFVWRFPLTFLREIWLLTYTWELD